MRPSLIALGLALSFALPLSAQIDASAAARAAAQNLANATLALQEAASARDRVTALTGTIRAYEDGLLALREGLRRAAIREAAIRQEWDGQRDQVSRLVGVMASMENSSGPMLLLHPTGPLGTARSGMILSDVAPALQSQADALRRDLEEIATLRQVQQGAADTLQTGLAAVQQARVDLSQAIADRGDLPHRFAESPDELAGLVQSVDTLEGFADLLGDTQIGPESVPQPFSEREGTLALPVQGSVIRRFGEEDSAGVERPGILIAARPRALVTAPAPATIRYMGPLLDYGNVMILEPEGGYLLVLAGLDVLYGEVGQVIPEGSPVGLMPGSDTSAVEFVALATRDLPAGTGAPEEAAPEGAEEDAEASTGTGVDGTERTETLYMEIRRVNRPTDPAEWFAQTRE